jgi:hypothetical protein
MSDKEITARYQQQGNDRFYRSLLASAIDKLANGKANVDITSPEIELINQAAHFLSLYRKTGLDVYLDMSRCFRKAGHKIYRLMLKKSLIHRNPKFLQLVS